jgi:hypothetical protein
MSSPSAPDGATAGRSSTTAEDEFSLTDLTPGTFTLTLDEQALTVGRID